MKEQKYRYQFQNPELPLEMRVRDLVSKLTLDEKINLTCQYQDEITRLGVNKYKHGTEAAHGIAWLGKATSFPQPIGLACTWDKEVLRKVGEAIGMEARGFFRKDPAINGLTLWAPTVDMERDPRWGRTEEAYGEDPVLAGKLAASLVRGIQGDHPFYVRAVGSLKHFIGNNNEIDRGNCSVSIDPRNMREYYLKAFEIPFREGGALSMMTAYNSVNGVPANLSPDINDIVKREWGMDGFVVSDAGDVLGTVNDHRYFEHYKHAVAGSIKSGIDSITDDHNISKQAIRDSLAEGLLTENDLDVALGNGFRVRFRLGEFDLDDRNPYVAIDESAIMAPVHQEVSLEAARKNIVLLKNDGALPLNPLKTGSIAVTGPLADNVYRDWYSGLMPYAVTPLAAIRAKLDGRGVIDYTSGNDHVKFSADGLYVRLNEDGKLAAIAEDQSSAETFEVTDWGWQSNTIVAASTGKFLTTDDRVVTADASEVFGWFTKEVFLLDRSCGGARINLSTWNNAEIGIDEEGVLAVIPDRAEKRSSLGSPEEREAIRSYETPPVRSVTLEALITEDGLREAVESARNAEAAVVFVGNHPLVNGKETMDRPDIILPEAQQRLIREVAAVCAKTIVVIVGSYPFALGEVESLASAILYTSHAGQELGNALADVLFGEFAPAGRLNMTWYRSVQQLPDFMDYDIIRGERTYQYFQGDPQYPFGHGLTYVPFEYSNLQIDGGSLAAGGETTIRIDVRNCGTIASDEVVQLYIKVDASRVKRPLKQLIDFRRLRIDAGETVEVSFVLQASELAFWDVTQDRWCIENGIYTLSVGRSSTNLVLSGTLAVQGETIPPRDLTQVTYAMNYDDYTGVFIDECREGRSSVAAKNDGLSWIGFEDAAFTRSAVRFEARISGEESGTIEISLDNPEGPTVGSCEFTATGGKQSWHTVSCAAAIPAGTHNIVLKLSSGMNISWFRFV